MPRRDVAGQPAQRRHGFPATSYVLNYGHTNSVPIRKTTCELTALLLVLQQKSRLQTEKNSWRFGLNYLFETLKQHKDWYARNQQFVQLRKDVRRFETHVSTVRTILAESVSKLDLEAGLRGAELEGRVGAYKIMFEVTKIVSSLSRPLVKLQILKPNEASLSVYCDTFVLDIALSGGEVRQSGQAESLLLQ